MLVTAYFLMRLVCDSETKMCYAYNSDDMEEAIASYLSSYGQAIITMMLLIMTLCFVMVYIMSSIAVGIKKSVDLLNKIIPGTYHPGYL